MTTVATVADTRASVPTLRRPAAARGLAVTGDWVRGWSHAFRAAAAAPRREGMDPAALARFGRE